jgi:hypothetical protein
MEPILDSSIEGICHWNIFSLKNKIWLHNRAQMNFKQIISITKVVRQQCQLPCAYVSTTVEMSSQDLKCHVNSTEQSGGSAQRTVKAKVKSLAGNWRLQEVRCSPKSSLDTSPEISSGKGKEQSQDVPLL